MAGVRRGIMFILGIVCFMGSILEDPIHLTSLFVGLLLMGVITWDQVAATFGRGDRRPDGAADTPPGGGGPVG